MKTLSQTLVFCCALLFPLGQLYAQDPVFSQFYASPIISNPAMAGYGVCGGRVATQYRQQWAALGRGYQTAALSYDQKLGRQNGAYGLYVVNDVAGDGLLKTLGINGVYNYTIGLGKHWQLNTAVQFTHIQRSIDFSRLRFPDQIEPKKGFIYPTGETLPTETHTLSSLSTGALLSGRLFYAGVAVFHLNEPSQSFYGNTDAGTYLPRRFNLQSGLTIRVGNSHAPDREVLTLSPNVLLAMQEKFSQLNLGFYASKGGLVTGVWYRQTQANPDAVICILGWQQEQFKFGYSYDITVSRARAAVKGTHELSLSYQFCLREIKPPRRREVCPGF